MKRVDGGLKSSCRCWQRLLLVQGAVVRLAVLGGVACAWLMGEGWS